MQKGIPELLCSSMEDASIIGMDDSEKMVASIENSTACKLPQP